MDRHLRRTGASTASLHGLRQEHTPALPNSGLHALLPDRGAAVGGHQRRRAHAAEGRRGAHLHERGGRRRRRGAPRCSGDKQGRIWAGTNGGCRSSGRALQELRRPRGLHDQPVPGDREDASGVLWISPTETASSACRTEPSAADTQGRASHDLVLALFDRQGGRCGSEPTAAAWRATPMGASRATANRTAWRARYLDAVQDQDGSLWPDLRRGLFRRQARAVFRGLSAPTVQQRLRARARQDHEGSSGSAATKGGLRGCATASSRPTARARAPQTSQRRCWPRPTDAVGGNVRRRAGSIPGRRFETWSRRTRPAQRLRASLADRPRRRALGGTNGGGVARFAAGPSASQHPRGARRRPRRGARKTGTARSGSALTRAACRAQGRRVHQLRPQDGLGANLVMAPWSTGENASGSGPTAAA